MMLAIGAKLGPCEQWAVEPGSRGATRCWTSGAEAQFKEAALTQAWKACSTRLAWPPISEHWPLATDH